MRSKEEMLDLILKKAENDDRIRAVTMEGSRANENATHDEFSDFDICYFVTDVREFTNDRSFIKYFGDILIVQYPTDWYKEPYDYSSRDNYTFLIQFTDGNRIDLTVIDLQNIEREREMREPRIVLLNKDNLPQLFEVSNERAFFIERPSAMEFYNTCNEFRWISLYVSKGLCREELYYAKYAFDVLLMDMFMKMLNWKVALQFDFQVTTGAHEKYLKRYLTKDELERFHGIFPNGTYADIFEKLFLAYDFFAELASDVAGQLSYPHDAVETAAVREFLQTRQAMWEKSHG